MRILRYTLVLLSAWLASACAIHSTHHSSSVVSYLYPDKSEPVVTPSIPNLSLPLDVGIAFVPESGSRHDHLTEQDKTRLLEEVSNHFRKYDFVRNIEIIPSAYLRPGGSFTNLEQIRTMYGIDVIALVSYDQSQFTDEGVASITYWTLIGAYIVPGEKNDTHTMVDAVVYDIPSRRMLFRAPGISHIKGHATPVNLSEQLRKDSLQGFQEASADLIGNLDTQLAVFREKVRQAPDQYRITRKAGYTGAGSLDALIPLLALGLVCLHFLRLRRKS